MITPPDPLSLATWRRAVGEIYANIRASSGKAPRPAWLQFRAARDDLFKNHPQSPLDPELRPAFSGLDYFDYDHAWRLKGRIDTAIKPETFELYLSADGRFSYTRVAHVRFVVQGKEVSLSLYWVEGYGGGLFLPFKDATSGKETYGGGRYLYDTIKGADLGADKDEILLDFNYAYNPSCAYDDRWVCPLAPPENNLTITVRAGEKNFE